MKNILLLFIALLSFHSVNAQKWYKQIIRGEIAISFPFKPEHKFIDSGTKETFLARTNNCGFMVGVLSPALKNYDVYLKSPDSIQQMMAMSFIENIAKGKIGYKNQHLISMKPFGSRKYYGLDIEYETVKSPSPDSRKRFSTLLLVNNTFYTIECWYLDDEPHEEEKQKFFKSIKIKNSDQ